MAKVADTIDAARRMRAEGLPDVSESFTPIPRETLGANGERVASKRLSQAKFEPLGNWCLIKEVDAAINTGHIIVPEAYGQAFRKGIVCATGPGTVFSSGTFIECTLSVGDVVMFGKSGGLDITLQEGAFKLVRESECFGRIPK